MLFDARRRARIQSHRGLALGVVETAGSIRWAEQARKGRRRLYPVTAVYSLLATAALVHALRVSIAATAASWLAGVAFWTWVEYMVHRFVLHGVFPDGPGLRRLTHRLFDHLHVEHHKRPWDGNHINGTLKDTAPFLAPAAALALLLPPQTLLAFLAGLVQAYVVEEWVHHCVHFYHFDNLYFRYIKRHHLYHHSRAGGSIAFGLTSAAWDVACGTRIPEPVRAALYRPLVGDSARRSSSAFSRVRPPA
jgi:sterol desaturase/sphingolipid hydroxylase (fatty acid hydroxylase superfamily)